MWIAAAMVLAAGCSRSGQKPVPDLDLAGEIWGGSFTQQTNTIDFGTAEARSHLLEGWSGDELWEGETTFVWADRQTSILQFQHFEAGPLTLEIRCRPFAVPGNPPQTVSATLNGVGAPVVTLREGFATYQLRFPASASRLGKNLLELRYSEVVDEALFTHNPSASRTLTVAWDWFRVEGSESGDWTEAKRPLRTAPHVLFLPYGVRADYFVEACPNSRLVWDEMPPGLGPAEVAGRLHVILMRRGSSRPHVVELNGDSLGAHASIPLGAVPRPTLARISLIALPPLDAPRLTDGLTLMNPRVVSGDARCIDGTRGMPRPVGEAEDTERLPEPPTAGPAPNIIIYLVDTLRADRLGVYGYERPTSPAIDRLARDGVTFRNAFAQSGWTKTAVASILTGLLPTQHGVLEREDSVPSWAVMLPELLRSRGYSTFAASASDVVSPYFGFDRGFDRFESPRAQRAGEIDFAISEQISAAFTEWLDGRAEDRPFFAYLHTMDPHDPYDPSSRYRKEFVLPGDSVVLDRPRVLEIEQYLADNPAISAADVQHHLSSLYDAEIAQNDKQFGNLIEGLKLRGLYDSSLILFISDHGEEFQEHGGWGHGKSLYREILHVPLILKLPGSKHAGAEIAQPVAQVDVLPSLLAVAGVELPHGVVGAPLQDLLVDGERAELAWIPSLLSLDGVRAQSLIEGGKHLIWKEPGAGDTGTELYDLLEDVREERDLSKDDPVLAGFLRSHLVAIGRRLRPLGGPEKVILDREIGERLRALGYM